MGINIEGISAGVSLDIELIKKAIERRKPYNNKVSTTRIENDNFEFVSGVFKGFTTGGVISILVKNENCNSKDYDFEVFRPSHADYTAYIKYKGFNDYRGGGFFSGRLTLLLVIAGSICKQMMKEVKIVSHVKKIGNIVDDDINLNVIDRLSSEIFPVVNEDVKDKMIKLIEKISEEGDSIGGIIEIIVRGVDIGIGDPYFDSVESIISHLLFSIPAVKGVEFGRGFDFANYKGSEINDSYTIIDDKIRTTSNNNGGINGGITNGEDIKLSVCIKPTPSILISQNTVNINKERVNYSIRGRHDSAIIARSAIIIESVIAIALYDLYLARKKEV